MILRTQNQWQYEETRVLTELVVALLRFLRIFYLLQKS